MALSEMGHTATFCNVQLSESSILQIIFYLKCVTFLAMVAKSRLAVDLCSPFERICHLPRTL